MQTSYANPAPAFAGMISNLQGRKVDTMLQGETAAEIAFGKFVVESAAQVANGTAAIAKLPAGAGDDFAGGGIVVHSHDYDKRLDMGLIGVLPKKQLSVMKEGRIWVVGEQLMLKTSDVFVRYTVNGLLVVGDFRLDADAGKALRIYGCRVITPNTVAGGLFELEVDMPAHRAH